VTAELVGIVEEMEADSIQQMSQKIDKLVERVDKLTNAIENLRRLILVKKKK
jgi:hypothetical protein